MISLNICFSQAEMRELDDKLTELNAAWDEEVKRELGKDQPPPTEEEGSEIYEDKQWEEDKEKDWTDDQMAPTGRRRILDDSEYEMDRQRAPLAHVPTESRAPMAPESTEHTITEEETPGVRRLKVTSKGVAHVLHPTKKRDLNTMTIHELRTTQHKL